MRALDCLVPAPRLRELDELEIPAPLVHVWEALREGELAPAPLVRALFALRTLPEGTAGTEPAPASLRIDTLHSTPARPGFQLLVELPRRELAVGAIGQVWKAQLPFVHVADADAFAAYAEAGFVKVAWALQVEALRPEATRVALELRVDATDEAAWSAFSHYFLVIGPASRFIRRAALSALAHKLANAQRGRRELVLPGDELLADAQAEITHEISIQATPARIWPWLVQMGCDRAGFYGLDALDHAGARSARELRPEWQKLEVGQTVKVTPDGRAQLEVLQLDAPHTLVLGGLFDTKQPGTLRFTQARPEAFWHVTWTFSLRSESTSSTRVYVRARAAFSAHSALHAAWIRPVHWLMEKVQLQNLRARAEGTLARDDTRDVIDGAFGGIRIALELLAPFRRSKQVHWGLDATVAQAKFPGDERVGTPDWSWTHAIEVDANAAQVWPWVAQLGANRAGFYSYQWLENLAGSDIRNANEIHPEWQVRLGDAFFLHPKARPLEVVAMEPGRWFLVYGGSRGTEHAAKRPWACMSWLFAVEQTGPGHCRVISRFRCTVSRHVLSQLLFGPRLMQPIGFAMDRRMLLGIRERAEHQRALQLG